MPDGYARPGFPDLNQAYSRAFAPGRLTLGVVMPIAAYDVGALPDLERDIARAQRADRLGFAALWLRDVPFNVPSFGDTGQIYDPFVYLGVLAAQTERIGLGVASLILPLRHPAHVAKASASVDQLSGGRMLLGVASGDRPDEYPAMAMDYADRGARFRDSLAYIEAMADPYPTLESSHGTLGGAIDMLPKPLAGRIPTLITGGSQQPPDWVAAHGDGWITYPRDAAQQAKVVQHYRAAGVAAGAPLKPVMQSLYIDLVPEADAPPMQIHLGFRAGLTFLRRYLGALRDAGVNHVALNLRFNAAPIEDTLERLAEALLPEFPIQEAQA
ncbi:MAG: LLM class oxidoreductase [Pseudomonadota bacterium]